MSRSRSGNATEIECHSPVIRSRVIGMPMILNTASAFGSNSEGDRSGEPLIYNMQGNYSCYLFLISPKG
ncbi:hypothetical protein R1flu_015984 [Riccia fluitans]|uniref:Uncharacterized protein n=1 Tax=Riccia fluitans TaxID=41844 RepID=A0ABD1YL19_9MARC